MNARNAGRLPVLIDAGAGAVEGRQAVANTPRAKSERALNIQSPVRMENIVTRKLRPEVRSAAGRSNDADDNAKGLAVASHALRIGEIRCRVHVEEQARRIAEPRQLTGSDPSNHRELVDECAHSKLAALQLSLDDREARCRIRCAERLETTLELRHRCVDRRVETRRDEAQKVGGDERHVPRDDENVVAGGRRECGVQPDETSATIPGIAYHAGARQPALGIRRIRGENDVTDDGAERIGNAIDDSSSADRLQSLRLATEARVRATGDDRADQTRSPRSSAASSSDAVSARSTISDCVGAPRRSFR